MSSVNPQASHWYCVRSQLKRERVAAEHLRRLDGVEVFAPRLRYRKVTARGRIWWVEPLFPGYVMVRMNLEEMKNQVSYCTGVQGLVHFGRIIPSIPEDFIRELQHEVLKFGDETTITTTPTIEIGDEVKVADGPLRGMAATVLEVLPATERVRVLIEFLGQHQAVDLDLFSLLLPRKPALSQQRV